MSENENVIKSSDQETWEKAIELLRKRHEHDKTSKEQEKKLDKDDDKDLEKKSGKKKGKLCTNIGGNENIKGTNVNYNY